MTDLFEEYHNFAKEVAKALTDAGIGEKEGIMRAVMIMVADPKNHKVPPYGGSLNYIKGKWEVQIEMAEVSKSPN